MKIRGFALYKVYFVAFEFGGLVKIYAVTCNALKHTCQFILKIRKSGSGLKS